MQARACAFGRASSVGLNPLQLRADIWTALTADQRLMAMRAAGMSIRNDITSLEEDLLGLDPVEAAAQHGGRSYLAMLKSIGLAYAFTTAGSLSDTALEERICRFGHANFAHSKPNNGSRFGCRFRGGGSTAATSASAICLLKAVSL